MSPSEIFPTPRAHGMNWPLLSTGWKEVDSLSLFMFLQRTGLLSPEGTVIQHLNSLFIRVPPYLGLGALGTYQSTPSGSSITALPLTGTTAWLCWGVLDIFVLTLSPTLRGSSNERVLNWYCPGAHLSWRSRICHLRSKYTPP